MVAVFVEVALAVVAAFEAGAFAAAGLAVAPFFISPQSTQVNHTDKKEKLKRLKQSLLREKSFISSER